MFRGERPQKGRLRQFNQIGAEMIGPGANQPYQDAEMIALAVNLLKSFGLTNFKLKINSLGNPEDKENLAKLLREKLQPYIGELSEYSQQRFERNVFRILDSKDENDKEILKKIDLDYSFLSKESQQNYAQVKEALTAIGIDFEEDINLVRGLDYYNYTVFEISDDSLGSQNALGAGGRYNNLVGFLGGDKKADIGGIGFSLGVERIILGMNKCEGCSGEALDVFFVPLDEAAYKKAFELMSKMREKGISTDMNYSLSSMKSQMRSADKSGALSVIVLGDEEIKTQKVALKNMRPDVVINNEDIIQCLSECGFESRKD
jgi:histidyl-tRNA synthetase